MRFSHSICQKLSGRLNPFYRSRSFFFCSGSISTPSPSSNKGNYFTLSHMVSSFLEKFNSQSFLRDWLCIKMGMKKTDWFLMNQSAMYLFLYIYLFYIFFLVSLVHKICYNTYQNHFSLYVVDNSLS